MRNQLVLFVIYVLFALMLIAGAALPVRRNEASPPATDPATDPPGIGTEETAPVYEPDYRDAQIIAVFDAKEETEVQMPLEEYVTHVVMAEMEYTAPKEALRAQAVAARTYCLYRMAGGQAHGDTGACVCTDYTHCMAFLSDAEAEQRWGEEAAREIYSAIRAAVRETEGEYLVYDGRPIAAMFHASSYRCTESAENVWGTPYPYLVSVPTYEQEEPTVTEIGTEQLRSILSEAGEAVFSSALFEEAPTLLRDDAGRVCSFRAFGWQISGTALRSLLGLRSTCIELSAEGDVFRFTCRGHGHGVGMSQEGAVRLASNGANYREILFYYYTGVNLIHA